MTIETLEDCQCPACKVRAVEFASICDECALREALDGAWWPEAAKAWAKTQAARAARKARK